MRAVKRHTRFATAWRHLWLVIKPALTSTGFVIFWWHLRKLGILIPRDDADMLSSGVMATVGVAFGVMAALVVQKVWDEWKTIARCIRENDRQSFLNCRDDRIPGTIHVLLFAHAGCLLGLAMLYDYASIVSGVVSVGTIGFILVLYFEISTELDDPKRGAWYLNVPPEWLTAENGNGHGSHDPPST